MMAMEAFRAIAKCRNKQNTIQWPVRSWSRCYVSGKAEASKEAHDQDKMVEEGGGSTSNYHEAKQQVKDDTSKKGNIIEEAKHHAEIEMNSARNMVKDMPEKAKETARDIKEASVIAGEALKKDAGKLAEKVGLKSETENAK